MRRAGFLFSEYVGKGKVPKSRSVLVQKQILGSRVISLDNKQGIGVTQQSSILLPQHGTAVHFHQGKVLVFPAAVQAQQCQL